MDSRLTSKVAIVTGGSAGIGLAYAKVLHVEGVHAVIASRNAGRLEEARTSILADGKSAEGVAVPADMSQIGDILTVVMTARDRFGKRKEWCRSSSSAAPLFSLAERSFNEDLAEQLEALGFEVFCRSGMVLREIGRLVTL